MSFFRGNDLRFNGDFSLVDDFLVTKKLPSTGELLGPRMAVFAA